MRGAVVAAAGIVVVVVGAACGASDDCKKYVACQNAYDASVDTGDYEDGGACWLTLQTANACTERCKAALDAIAEIPDAPKVCVDAAAANAVASATAE